MKSSLRFPALPGVQEKFLPSAKVREIVLLEPGDGSTPEKAYLGAVRKAHRNDCIILPPGVYPPPPPSRSLSLRALRPGTVRIQGTAKAPVFALNSDGFLFLSGIEIVAASGEPALQQTKGCVIFSNCQISGGLQVRGNDTSVFLENCRIDHADVGLELSQGATGEITGSSVIGCLVGISAEKSAGLGIFHCRIEGSFRNESDNPGAGLHAEETPVYCAGTLFVENQLGAHFVHCKGVELLFCLFERQSLGGVMMHGGGPLHVHSCVFSGQLSSDYAHVTLENVHAAVDFCHMDSSTGPEVQSAGGNVTRRLETPPKNVDHNDVLSAMLEEIHQVIGMNESKAVMENILHQAYAAIQRRQRGLPVPPLKFHCIFEGEEGSGRRQAAVLLCRALGALGILGSGDKVVEARLEDLLLGGANLSQIVQSAKGGLLLLHSPVQIDRRDSRLSYSRAREVLRAALDACNEDTVLIFTGSRDNVRPILRSSAETEEFFRATLHFSLPSPPELAEMFATLAEELHITMTTKARMKILLAMHMIDDRRDRRFLNTAGIAKLLDASQKRYFERCSRERNFDLPLEAGDIDVPTEKNADILLLAQPVFINICPRCESENPWIPSQAHRIRCANCDHLWETGWGIWKNSSYYRRLRQEEEAPVSVGLPPHRGRAAISG